MSWEPGTKAGRRAMGTAFAEIAGKHGYEVDVMENGGDYLINTIGDQSASLWISKDEAAIGYLLAWIDNATPARCFSQSFAAATGCSPVPRPARKLNAMDLDYDAILSGLDEGLALLNAGEALVEAPPLMPAPRRRETCQAALESC